MDAWIVSSDGQLSIFFVTVVVVSEKLITIPNPIDYRWWMHLIEYALCVGSFWMLTCCIIVCKQSSFHIFVGWSVGLSPLHAIHACICLYVCTNIFLNKYCSGSLKLIRNRKRNKSLLSLCCTTVAKPNHAYDSTIVANRHRDADTLHIWKLNHRQPTWW